MNVLIKVQFYSTATYTYEAPDDLPEDAKIGDLVLVPVGDQKSKNYSERFKVARLNAFLGPEQEMAEQSKARKLKYKIKKASMWLDPKIVSI